MPVTIRLTKVNEPDTHRDLVFNQPVISIGRETTSTLSLSDPQVSKNHARIEREKAGYRIFDLKSTNATYLNGERLVPEQGYALHQNDVVKIAGYILELGFLEDSRIPAGSSVNPATTFSQSQVPDSGDEKASAPHSGDAPGIAAQWSKLKDELVDMARYIDHVDVNQLTSRNQELTRLCDELRAENQVLKDQLAQISRDPVPVTSQPEPAPSEVSLRSGELHGILLQAVLKLLRGQLSFRSEFLGMTVLKDTGPIPVDFPSVDEAVRYFADPALPDTEVAARLESLKKATEQIILHVIGVMEGYRQSVEEGSKVLLQRTDPLLLKKDLLNANFKLGPLEIPYRLLPFLLPLRIVQLAMKRHQDLRLEDRGVLEKRYYRPGFVHGYEACVAQGMRESKVRPDDNSGSRRSDH